MTIISVILLVSSLFVNVEWNNSMYEQTVEPVIPIVEVIEKPEIVVEKNAEPLIIEAVDVEEISMEVLLGAVVGFAEKRLAELPSEYGYEDKLSLIDVERTLSAMTILLEREPTERELIYMTIWTEYWIVVTSHSQTIIGQEAVARSYYQFCGIDECTREELIRFLSGYQPWFKRTHYVDIDPFEAAEYLLQFLHEEGGDVYNYVYGNGDKLYKQVDEILDL